jgi:hypothetical protein
MASAGETHERVARESERRARLAVPALAGGVLYLLSGIIITATVNGAPRVGVVQGLEPALRGMANTGPSPRAVEVKYISHHAFALIAGSVLAAIAVVALTLILVLLFDAARFRRPESWAAARPLVIAGGIALPAVSLAHQVISAIKTHQFAVGHDFSKHAVDVALTKGGAYTTTNTLGLVAGLALAAGMIAVSLNSMRVGLLPRWMGMLGIFTGVLLILPLGAVLDVVPAFWMVMMGILFVGRWPNGDPPAWAAGEARPWPTGAQQRAGRRGERAPEAAGATAGRGAQDVGTGAGAERASQDAAAQDTAVAPVPVRPPTAGTSRKRRRKRGARR